MNFSAAAIFDKLKTGNRAALSKAITFIESSSREHQRIADELLDLCLPLGGNAWKIGITGVPGAGKSSFINEIGKCLADQGRKIGVLAIDPSSQKSKGSILGDKTRMTKLVNEDDVFIRPSPAGEQLGGVARKTRETVLLLEAAGFDTILIETVGVGQSEISVHSMVDFLILLVLTGAGDELQGMKRGIMEIADAVIITKADNHNLVQAQNLKREYQAVLSLWPQLEFWPIPVLLHSVYEPKFIVEIQNIITKYMNEASKNGFLEEKRQNQRMFWLQEDIKFGLNDLLSRTKPVQQRRLEVEQLVAQAKISTRDGSRMILEEFIKEVKHG